MVVPDRPEGPPPRRRLTPLSAVALAALAVGAVAVLANQTAPDAPETTDPTIAAPAAPTTTTDLLIRGDALDLWTSLTLDEGRTPLGIAERDGALYLFTSTDVDSDGMPRGLTLLVSEDGIRWEGGFSGLDQENSVRGVVSTPGGFVAYGSEGLGSQPVFWTSADGRQWEPSLVSGPHPGWRPFGFAAAERMRLVWGVAQSGNGDPWEMLEAALRDRFGDLADRTSHYSDSTGEHRILLFGPLGVPLLEVTLEELGLELDVLDSQTEWQIEVQASLDDGPWVNMAIPDNASPAHWFIGPDREIWVMSYDDRGGTRLFSIGSGYVWQDRGTLPPNTGWVETWRDGLVAMTHYQHDVLLSGDGADWSSTGVRDFFSPRHRYDIGRMAAGEGGIALVAHHQQGTDAGPRTPPVVEIAHSGYVVRVTEAFLSVLRPGTAEVVLRVPLHSDVMTPSVSYDPDDRTVTLANHVTGETYLTLTLDELARIEQELWEQQHPDAFDSRIALITSPDGCNWTSQIVVQSGARTGVQDLQSVGPWVVLTVAYFDSSWRVSRTEVLIARHGEPAPCPWE